jgi:hypothetical protein
MAFGHKDGWEWARDEHTPPEVDGRTALIGAYSAMGMCLLLLASLGGWYVGWLPVASAYSALFYFSVRAYDNEHDGDSPAH